ncbi:MAG: hypothetical protein FJY35_03130 [Betaproteobacteria bacterium]|nr:hypothetical protein [Betaproteobacteria bacterium]
MKRCKKVIVFFGALASTMGSSMAGELRTELQKLRDTHPLIRASQFAVEASDLRRQAAMAGFLPKITISGDTGDEKIESATLPITPPTKTDYQRSKRTYTLEQNIFSGGKTFAEVDIATIDRSLKQSEARASSQDILLEALVAYLQVLRNQLLIRLSEINEETTQQQLAMEKARVERGGGVVVDELQAATRLQIVRERRVFYEQGMRDSIANYEQVFGHVPSQEKIQDLDNFVDLIPADVEVAVLRGQEFNPRLQQIRLQIDRAARSINLERSNLLPKVDFVLSRSRDKEVAGIFKKDEDSALVRFSWNIFSGGDSMNRTRAAALDRNEAMEREISTQRKTSESIRMAWNQYQKGQERLKLLETAAETSQRVMEGRKRLRDSGRETVLAVLDAEVEHFGILANKVNAMIDARLGSYRLLHVTGLLDISTLNLDSDNFRLPIRPLEETLNQLLGWKKQPVKPSSIVASAPKVEEVPSVVTPPSSTTSSIPPTSPKPKTPSAKPTPEIAPSAQTATPVTILPVNDPLDPKADDDPSLTLTKKVLDWAEAWSGKDFDSYSDFYSEVFQTTRFKSKSQWLDYRKPRIVGKRSISVEIRNLVVKVLENGRAEAVFEQNYKAGNLKVRSAKKLQFIREDDSWRILWEGN